MGSQGHLSGVIMCKCGSNRGDRIRTCDPLHPIQVRYQAALRPEFLLLYTYHLDESIAGVGMKRTLHHQSEIVQALLIVSYPAMDVKSL